MLCKFQRCLGILKIKKVGRECLAFSLSRKVGKETDTILKKGGRCVGNKNQKETAEI